MKSMQKIIKNKKGVSPLIATILLIAFAVALGAVVMSWGKSVDFSVEGQASEKCARVGLSVEKINGVPQIFYGGIENNGFIKFTIENNGNEDIEGIIVWVVGEKNTNTIDLEKSSIKVGYPLIKEIKHDFSRYGEIKKLKFIPKIKVGDSVITCAKNSLEEEKINPVI